MASPQMLKVVLGVFTGMVSGGVVTGLVSGGVTYAAAKEAEHDDRRGWNLVPVVVAARDIARGEKLQLDAIAQRPIPEQFITPSVVMPDSASYVVGSTVTVPLSKGDPLNWGFFSTARPMMAMPGEGSRRAPEVWEACDAALAASPTAAKRERTPADTRARLVQEAQR